jgi:lysophospholipase L1-like esterase
MSIHRSLIVVLAVFLMLLGVNPAIAAPAGGSTPAPRFAPPGRYYLALGDSLAFGYQQARFNANFPTEPPAAFNTGYVDDFASLLTGVRTSTETVNDSCPGETSGTFLVGGCPYTSTGFTLHNSYSGSQMDAALSFLRSHPGQVNPITLDVGSNDFNTLISSCGLNGTTCLAQGAPAILTQYSANLSQILAGLRSASPTSEIIVMQYYDPYAPIQPLSVQIVQQQNAIIAALASTYRARVADAFTPFNLASPQPQTLCTLSLICSQSDIHPSDAGYGVLAQQFWTASGYGNLIDPSVASMQPPSMVLHSL